MTNKKPTMLHSERGSVFSVFSEEKLKNMTENSDRKVARCGRVNNSGIVDIPKGATLAEIIELAGGILDKKDLHKELNFSLFNNYIRAINILSEEDCIIQYSKFYIDSVIGLIHR